MVDEILVDGAFPQGDVWERKFVWYFWPPEFLTEALTFYCVIEPMGDAVAASGCNVSKSDGLNELKEVLKALRQEVLSHLALFI